MQMFILYPALYILISALSQTDQFSLINGHSMHNCQPVKTQLTNPHFRVRFYRSCYEEIQLGSVSHVNFEAYVCNLVSVLLLIW